jgi:hypothetical protein
MSTIVLDQNSAEKLANCGEPVVLRDQKGKVIGYFEPARLHEFEEGEIPQFDEDELDRREARHDGIPSHEVRRRLEKLR